MRIDYIDGNGLPVEGLKTTSIKKQSISPAAFVVPKNYTRVAMEDAVYHDKKSDESLERAFDWSEHVDPDMVEKPKKQHK